MNYMNYHLRLHDCGNKFKKKAFSPTMEGIVNVHYDILIIVSLILILVICFKAIYMFANICRLKNKDITYKNQAFLAIVHTIALLYASNKLVFTNLTIQEVLNNWKEIYGNNIINAYIAYHLYYVYYNSIKNKPKINMVYLESCCLK